MWEPLSTDRVDRLGPLSFSGRSRRECLKRAIVEALQNGSRIRIAIRSCVARFNVFGEIFELTLVSWYDL